MSQSNTPAAVLPRLRRAGYGVAEIGISGAEVLVRVSLLIFYTDVVGLRADLAGYAIALCVVWDAITDPLMGTFSDGFSIYQQRRRPYILIGALLLSATTLLLFSVPNLDSQAGKFLFLLGAYMLFNTAMTVIAVPHAAMAGDLTSDIKIRTELFGWRLFFANIGLVFGTALPGLAIAYFDRPGEAVVPGAADVFASKALAVFIILSAAVTLYSTRGLDKGSTHKISWKIGPYLRETVSALADRNFLVLFLAYCTANLGLSLNSSLALYYYRYRLLLDETATRSVIAIFMAVFCVFIPVWVVGANHLRKKTIIVANMLGLGLMTCIAYPLFPAGSQYWPLVAAVLGGIFIGSIVLLDVTVAEVADQDEAKTGRSRFGLYFGMWKMGGKISRAIALALTGNVLHWIGFQPNAVQSPETSSALAFVFGPVVGAFIVISAIISTRLKDTKP